MMTPTKKVISEMIGMAPTPAAMAWWMARCSMRPRFRGERNSSRSDLPKISRQPADVRDAALGCGAHLRHPLHHAVPSASCSVWKT